MNPSRPNADLAAKRDHVADATIGPTEEPKIAVTCKEGGTYPAAGSNVYPIIFQKATYTETAGVQTLTKTGRSAAMKAVAMNLGTGDVPEGTVIVIERLGRRNYFYWDA